MCSVVVMLSACSMGFLLKISLFPLLTLSLALCQGPVVRGLAAIGPAASWTNGWPHRAQNKAVHGCLRRKTCFALLILFKVSGPHGRPLSWNYSLSWPLARNCRRKTVSRSKCLRRSLAPSCGWTPPRCFSDEICRSSHVIVIFERKGNDKVKSATLPRKENSTVNRPLYPLHQPTTYLSPVPHLHNSSHYNKTGLLPTEQTMSLPLPPPRLYNPQTDTHLLPQLAQIQADCILQDNQLATFIPPLDIRTMTRFWTHNASASTVGVEPTMQDRRGCEIVLQMASSTGDGEDVVAGYVMLSYPWSQTGPFRAEVLKLMVSPRFRRRGVARRVMGVLEEVARAKGRMLLVSSFTPKDLLCVDFVWLSCARDRV